MEENNKIIHCSFCGKGRTEVQHMVAGPVVDNVSLYICNECVETTYDVLHAQHLQHSDIDFTVTKETVKKYTPAQIKKHLDKFVVGQESAKVAISVAVYNHYKRIANTSKIELDKSNLLLVGSSGSGKTLTVKTVAKLFNIPYVIADATTLTESGYVGDDVDTLIKKLIDAAEGDIDRAQQGIIFIDEIDKKSSKPESAVVSRDVSGVGVQQALLKLIEGTVVHLEDDFENSISFDTKDVLFICSGAFVGLDEIVRKSAGASMGFGASLAKQGTHAEALKNVTPTDFIKYGIIPEFVGRHPITVVFDDLDVDMLVRILKEPENSIVKQFQQLFKFDGVSLTFDDKYLQTIAEECIKQKIGARGLRAILEKTLQDTQFHLPTLAKEGVNKIHVDAAGAIKHAFKPKTKKRVNDDQ